MFRYRLRSLLVFMFAIAIISWIARFDFAIAAAIIVCATFGGVLGSWTIGHSGGFGLGAVCSVLGAAGGIIFAQFIDVGIPGVGVRIWLPTMVTGALLGGSLGGVLTLPNYGKSAPCTERQLHKEKVD